MRGGRKREKDEKGGGEGKGGVWNLNFSCPIS